MLPFPARASVSTSIGFVVGLAFASWVRPETNAGKVLLIMVSIIIAFLIGEMISWLLKLRQRHSATQPKKRSRDG